MLTNSETKRRLVKIRELSEYTSIPVGGLYQMVSRRQIPFVKLGRSLLFDLEKIQEWIQQNSVEKGNL